MVAPEKIYLQVCGDCKDNECDKCEFEVLVDNVTWCRDKIFDKDVEYTRTDAFIEKACRCYCDDICEQRLCGMCFYKHDGQGQIKNTFKYNECNELKLLINGIKEK